MNLQLSTLKAATTKKLCLLTSQNGKIVAAQLYSFIKACSNNILIRHP
jgi:hypothetical protein